MREAYGGTMMVWLMMMFIVLFVSFTAIIVSVAKTFRVKNGVINIVEQYDYANNQSNAGTIIDDYLVQSGYRFPDSDNDRYNECSSNGGDWYPRGVCIVPNDATNPEYYKVTVYVGVSLPFFGVDLSLPVSGETKSIERLS